MTILQHKTNLIKESTKVASQKSLKCTHVVYGWPLVVAWGSSIYRLRGNPYILQKCGIIYVIYYPSITHTDTLICFYTQGIEKYETSRSVPFWSFIQWVNSSAFFNFRSVPFQFHSIEQKLNRKGTGLEREWNRNGMGMEQESNMNGTGMERERNGNGTKVQCADNECSVHGA